METIRDIYLRVGQVQKIVEVLTKQNVLTAEIEKDIQELLGKIEISLGQMNITEELIFDQRMQGLVKLFSNTEKPVDFIIITVKGKDYKLKIEKA